MKGPGQNPTILVTGGCGFIGSNFIQFLLNRRPRLSIVNLDKLTYAGSLQNTTTFQENSNYTFVQGDIADSVLLRKLFKSHNISGVVHFAAESHVDNSIESPEAFINTNINGTFCLLEAARQNWQTSAGISEEKRFLHISTDEVFGSLGSTGYFREDSPYAPNSPYSASKASSDLLVRSYHRTYGLNAIITNCSNNFGPRQHREKFIPTVIRTALAGLPIPIYGTGNNVRDWLYVEDHCAALLKVFEQASSGEQYLIGGNSELSNIEMAQKICEQLDHIKPLEKSGSYASQIDFVTDRPGHDFRYAVNFEKIKKDLNWLPSTDIQSALQKTVSWYLHELEIS